MRLIEHVLARIEAAGGWINFADFMQQVLYAPGLGYYSAGAVKLGAAGDFVTAPEISPLFSRCVAIQCAQVLMATGGDTIVEAGAGSGVMAAEMLATLADLDAQPARYLIVEPSADLRERQQATIAARAPAELDRVAWPDTPPSEVRGVIVGNEVLDALPFERFERAGQGVQALGVRWDGARFAEACRPASEALADGVGAIEAGAGGRLPDGYRSELRSTLAPYVADWAARLRHGIMLWIDYGCSRAEYYSSQRCAGTLRCHYRHRAHDDPFVYPGLQDITAWVDFTTVAEAGVAAGLDVLGYTTQAHFLLGCGIEQQFTSMRSRREDPAAVMALGNEVRRLLMPAEMGETFRVIALGRDLAADPIGFSVRDLAASL